MRAARANGSAILFGIALVLCLGATSQTRYNLDKGDKGLLIHGTTGLPDLQRGKQALEDGRYADAEANLLPLAQRGYVDAQLALARLYAHLPDGQSKAIHWYRMAVMRAPLQAQVPLARLLLQQDDASQLREAQQLFVHAWDERQDPEALAGLIDLFASHPELDSRQQMPALADAAVKLAQPVTDAALIRWYRSTQDQSDHRARLLAMCRKSLALAPSCYQDLLRDARARGDHPAMQRMVSAAISQYGANLMPPDTLASMARALVAAPGDEDEQQGAAVEMSDAPEADAADLAPTADAMPVVQEASTQSCAEAPIGIATGTAAPTSAAAAPAKPVVANLPVPAANNAGKPAPAGASPAAAADQPPQDAQPDLANLIVAKLAKGGADAQVEAAGVVVRFPFLAPQFDPEATLLAARKQALPDTDLYLGELYMYGERAARDPRKALQFLQQAARNPASAVAADYELGRLYQFGYLDEVDPQRARDYLLHAARYGYVTADNALARLYASGKGTCPDHVYAYVFAKLGARSGAPAISTLRDQLYAALDVRERAQAQQLWKQELALQQQTSPVDREQTEPLAKEPP